MLWGRARKMGEFAQEKWAFAPIDFRKFPCTLLFRVHGPDEAVRRPRGSVGRAWPEKPLGMLGVGAVLMRLPDVHLAEPSRFCC
jgi:hypothetical protein